MRSLVRPRSALLIACALLAACAQPASSPPPPSPSPTPTPRIWPTETYVTLFEYPVRNGCGVVAIPYHAWVPEGGTIVWDVVNDACTSSPDVTLEFADPSSVQVDEKQGPKRKRARLLARERGKPYKYTVHLGAFVHDPEYEIWP